MLESNRSSIWWNPTLNFPAVLILFEQNVLCIYPVLLCYQLNDKFIVSHDARVIKRTLTVFIYFETISKAISQKDHCTTNIFYKYAIIIQILTITNLSKDWISIISLLHPFSSEVVSWYLFFQLCNLLSKFWIFTLCNIGRCIFAKKSRFEIIKLSF